MIYTFIITYLDEENVERTYPIESETIGQSIINFILEFSGEKYEIIGIKRELVFNFIGV